MDIVKFQFLPVFIITIPDTGKSKSFLSSISIVVTYDQIAVVRIRHIIQRLLEYRIAVRFFHFFLRRYGRCSLARSTLHRCCLFLGLRFLGSTGRQYRHCKKYHCNSSSHLISFHYFFHCKFLRSYQLSSRKIILHFHVRIYSPAPPLIYLPGIQFGKSHSHHYWYPTRRSALPDHLYPRIKNQSYQSFQPFHCTM